MGNKTGDTRGNTGKQHDGHAHQARARTLHLEIPLQHPVLSGEKPMAAHRRFGLAGAAAGEGHQCRSVVITGGHESLWLVLTVALPPYRPGYPAANADGQGDAAQLTTAEAQQMGL